MKARLEKQHELESLITRPGGIQRIRNEYRALTGMPVGLSENREGTNVGAMIKAIVDSLFPNDKAT